MKRQQDADPLGPDAPLLADAARMRTARGRERQTIAVAEARYVADLIEAFRREIGTIVRSTSPFLIALLASEGLLLDDVIEDIEPAYGWPRRPRVSWRSKTWPVSKHAFRVRTH